MSHLSFLEWFQSKDDQDNMGVFGHNRLRQRDKARIEKSSADGEKKRKKKDEKGIGQYCEAEGF